MAYLMMVVWEITDNGLNSESQKLFNEINLLVSVGMDIDEATKILKNAGFKVGKKYFPTKKKTIIR